MQLDRVRHNIRYGMRLCFLVCLPMTVGLFLLRHETVSLLFERGSFNAMSTLTTSRALAWHIVGLLCIALSRILVQVFYAFLDTWRPVIVGAISMVVNIVACYTLAPLLSIAGIAAANSLAALVQLICLLIFLGSHIKLGWDHQTQRSVAISAIATAAMGLMIWAARSALGTQNMHGTTALFLPYCAIVISAIVLYCGIAKALGHPEWQDIAQLSKKLVRRLRKR